MGIVRSQGGCGRECRDAEGHKVFGGGVREEERRREIGPGNRHFISRAHTHTHIQVDDSRLVLAVIAAPVDVLAVHVGSLAPKVRLESALQDGGPRQVTFVIFDRFVGPIEIGKVALVVTPFVAARVTGAVQQSRRRGGFRARDARLGRGRSGCLGLGLGAGVRCRRGGELGGEEAAASDTFTGLETRSEVGEVARLVKRNPPAAQGPCK